MSQGWFKKRSGDLVTVVEADLLPVLNIMFLLIPALLLAMEFASMASIDVSPPRMCVSCDTKPTTTTEVFKLTVEIRTDGFQAEVNGSASGEQIPLIDGKHDFAALAAAAKEMKLAHPETTDVTLKAESAVQLQTLVQTMDTLRGDDCKLAGVRKGEDVPADCMFWRPSVES